MEAETIRTTLTGLVAGLLAVGRDADATATIALMQRLSPAPPGATPVALVGDKPWYPDKSKWYENDGKRDRKPSKLGWSDHVTVLTRAEREAEGKPGLIRQDPDNLDWSYDASDPKPHDIVAYKKVG